LTWTNTLGRLAAQLTSHKPSLYPAEELDDLNDIRIGKLSVDSFEGEQKAHALALKAGLHLFNESLDASHELSQEIHTSTGSYWHGIMHRMEGDYSNAKYWFRMAGSHPVFHELGAEVSAFLRGQDLASLPSQTLQTGLESMKQAGWDPYRFVDLVEQQVTVARDARTEELLIHMQWLEMKRLLQYCYEQSGGGGQLIEHE
jgi:hypothetical protein